MKPVLGILIPPRIEIDPFIPDVDDGVIETALQKLFHPLIPC